MGVNAVSFRLVPLSSRSLTAVSLSGLDGVNAHDLLPGLVGFEGLVGLVEVAGLVGLAGLAGLVGLVEVAGLGGLVVLVGLGGCESAAVPHHSCTSFGYCSSGPGQRCPGGKLAPALSRSQGT
jgi:hypothetical protein